MIRVAVVLAALALVPAIAFSQPPLAAPSASSAAPTATAKSPVVDAYYAKRQQAMAQATAPPASSVSADASTVTAAAASAPSDLGSPSASAKVAPAIASAPIPRRPVDPYYAVRQSAAQMANAMRQPAQYIDDAPDAGTYERVQPGTMDAAVAGDSGTMDLSGMAGCAPAAGGPATLGPGGVLWDEIHSCRAMWTKFEFLNWWVKGGFIPPLLTTAPIGTPQATAGVLGDPNTTILFGDDRYNGGMRKGGRVTIGGWLVGDVVGLEGNYYALQSKTTRFATASNFETPGPNDRILARPFFDPLLGNLPRSLKLAFPNFVHPDFGIVQLSGGINISTSSDVQSAGLDLVRLAGIDFAKDHRMLFVLGYRFFRLDEDLLVSDNITITGGTTPPNTNSRSFDSFATGNQFHGMDFGLVSDLRRGRFVLETQARLALGNMHQLVNINGQQVNTEEGVPTVLPFGFLAQPSNIGRYHRNQFALIPEVGVKLGVQLTQRLRVTAGYNFTYVTRVARPGNEVDLVIDQASEGQPQTVQRPAFLKNSTDLWLQGVTSGFEYRF